MFFWDLVVWNFFIFPTHLIVFFLRCNSKLEVNFHRVGKASHPCLVHPTITVKISTPDSSACIWNFYPSPPYQCFSDFLFSQGFWDTCILYVYLINYVGCLSFNLEIHILWNWEIYYFFNNFSPFIFAVIYFCDAVNLMDGLVIFLFSLHFCFFCCSVF